MAVHYTYFDHLIPQVVEGEVVQHAGDVHEILIASIVGILFIAVGKLLADGIREPAQIEGRVVPSKRISVFGFFDFLVETFIQYHDSVVGKENRAHVPFTASLFFFIFLLNLVGLIPGMPAATTTVWLNVGMALVVFFYFNYHGIREHGFVNYMKHFMGPVWWLAPFLFCLELLSLCLRVVTLNLRLYWNISADHIVLGVFTDLLSPTLVAATPFYFVGLFVAFMQAFVFTTLTMVYILLATQHEGDH